MYVFHKQMEGVRERVSERKRLQNGGDDLCLLETCTNALDMITTNVPLFSRGISVPKEMTQLSVEAYAAGIVEGALDGLGFVSMDG